MYGLMGILDLLSQVLFFLGYLSKKESFPKPLKKEEELLCFKEFKENNNEEAKKKLIGHNLRLVAHIAKKYSSSNIQKEDLISIGVIGLIKSINSFDYNKGTKFATYAARCIENEILMALRSENKLSSSVFLEDYIGFDEEGNNISLKDVLSTNDDDIESKVNLKMESDRLYKIIDKVLDEREREIIYLRYGLKGKRNYTQREIAKMYGISRSYVSRIEKKAVSKIAVEFKGL